MSDLTAELHDARKRRLVFFKGIGEPCKEIPLDFICIHTDADGQHHATITYQNLIMLVEDALS